MEIRDLFSTDNLNVLTAIGIVAGLFFTAVSYRADAKMRRISNRLVLTRNHQRLWLDFYQRPQLARILDASADTDSVPVAPAEEVFVNLAIQQLSASFEAMQDDLTVRPEGIGQDISSFFSLPVPKAVWLKAKPLLNPDLVAFVESNLKYHKGEE